MIKDAHFRVFALFFSGFSSMRKDIPKSSNNMQNTTPKSEYKLQEISVLSKKKIGRNKEI